MIKKNTCQYSFALGIGRGRGIEPCAVERSTVANAKPCKARPRLSREGKGGNAQKNNNNNEQLTLKIRGN